MTAKRLAATVLCAGLGAAGAIAEDRTSPIDVAVPPDDFAAPIALAVPLPGEEGAEAAAGDGDEEYLPLDLPSLPGAAAAPEGPAGGVVPSVMPDVPGTDDTTAYYHVHADIMGIPNSEGMVSASLCSRRTFTKKGCRTERVAARQGQVSVTFSQVAPGAYAVQVHHDQNNNGKMDFTFLGLPKEPYGFSRDARPVLAPPKFDSASFEVVDGDVRLVINLQNV